MEVELIRNSKFEIRNFQPLAEKVKRISISGINNYLLNHFQHFYFETPEGNPDVPQWLNESHPNYIRWKRGRDRSGDRADFVKSLLNLNNIKTEQTHVLELGSGEGGTAALFSKNNFLASFDISLLRLSRQNNVILNNKVNGDGIFLPFKDNSFDLIIIQDVIEHVNHPAKLIGETARVLKRKGNIFLSTPNKFSFFNIIADPHWGLPFLALFKRTLIKKYFLKFFRKNEINRKDIAELSSLPQLKKTFQKEFNIKLCTKESVNLLLEGHKGIVWSNFHLRLIRLINFFKMTKAIKKISNNKFGIINIFFTPTFYFILNRKT